MFETTNVSPSVLADRLEPSIERFNHQYVYLCEDVHKRMKQFIKDYTESSETNEFTFTHMHVVLTMRVNETMVSSRVIKTIRLNRHSNLELETSTGEKIPASDLSIKDYLELYNKISDELRFKEVSDTYGVTFNHEKNCIEKHQNNFAD